MPIFVLVFLNVLAGTLVIPVIRPLMVTVGVSEHMMHAFIGANMLGAVLGAPFFALLSDRTGVRRRLAAGLSWVDAALLLGCVTPLPLPALLGARALQGAASVGALSIIMGQVGRTAVHTNGRGRDAGLAGSAVVAAIAAGPALGGLLVRGFGLYAPFQAAACCALLAGIGCAWLMPSTGGQRAPRAGLHEVRRAAPLLWVPTLWITAERFSVGCFVVTFSLFAHNVLGSSDARVGALLSCFMLPFACAMWPIGKLADKVGRPAVLAAGGVIYGLSFVLLGHTSADSVPVVLMLAGIASAAIYTPALGLTASLSPTVLRSTAMGFGNAGGTLGMLLGTIVAGTLTAVLRQRGMAPSEMYAWIFRVGGLAPLVVLLVTASALGRLARSESSVEPALGGTA
jgi:DHA2 family methylenomycin A resistance protein-like MFS transporter